ncbi:DUF4192 domain-containing protein [Flexivirga oryzae]|uniref:DUF4192 family protein n=1 Tax=Flexivirga oryzae TaxID=1794944 RepID=A0A839N3D7_9MICO|nr:DUF4192 domain-containing protein [Flexivirga oryzae]MBB2890584.1 hypothetical protein [Flexivirga oryzae]
MTSSVHGIGEIVAYLPYNLGFVPRHCLVVIGIRAGHICLTARCDRPTSAEVPDVVAHVVTTFARSDPDEVLVVCYDGLGAADRLFVLELGDSLRAISADISHVLLVQNGVARWRAEQCSCDICPREWAPVPPAIDVAPVAERVARGVVPAEHRADLVRRLEVRHPLVARAVEARITAGEPLPIDTAQALPRVMLDGLTPVHAVPVDTLAAATVAVGSITIRDQVLSWLMPDFLPGELIDVDAPIDPHHLGLPPMWLREVDSFDDPVATLGQRLEDWVACIPPPRSVPVLMLLAGIRWTSGNGALASIAVARALEIDRHCRLALLFAQALNAGLRPGDGEQRPA